MESDSFTELNILENEENMYDPNQPRNRYVGLYNFYSSIKLFYLYFIFNRLLFKFYYAEPIFYKGIIRGTQENLEILFRLIISSKI